MINLLKKGNLNKHLKTVIERSWKCEHCGREFSEKFISKSHLRNVHEKSLSVENAITNLPKKGINLLDGVIFGKIIKLVTLIVKISLYYNHIIIYTSKFTTIMDYI